MDLFSGPGPRVFTVPAAASFLDVLSEAMVQALVREDQPFALADAVVLLPNRRSSRSLMDAFARRLGGAALAPVMRPLADLEDDPDVWGAEPLSFAVPAAIDPLRRRLELAALVRRRESAAGGVDDPVRALAFADALCALLDGAAAADGVDWSGLADLVTDANLAEHWRQSAAFLEIIATYWPQRLAADSLLDPAMRRNRVLDALTAHWSLQAHTGPVVIAGSTGSIAATRRLMAVVARMPMGAVVLPGLDRSLDDAAWDAVGPQHPQFSLKETLRFLDLPRHLVSSLDGSTAVTPRELVLREALAPADTTADWLVRLAEAGGADTVRAGAAGLRLVEAETEDEEAAVIALALREAVETEGSTAALVTPSATLARRVASKLSRWGVNPATSIGRPLGDTAVGGLISLLTGLAEDNGDPVLLAGLLKHPLCDFGVSAQDVARFEHAWLRGARRYGPLADLVGRKNGEIATVLLEALSSLLSLSDEETVQLDKFSDALAQAYESVAGERAWTAADGEAAAQLFSGLIAHGESLGAMRLDQARRALMQMMAGKEAAPEGAGDGRISILGPLEARLQRRDLIVLAGLNEGVWPESAREDAFLSRSMRSALGLLSPDVRVGLSAHDFAQLAAAPRVLMTRAKRQDGAPTVASRWVWRLATLMRGALPAPLAAAPAALGLLAWARMLDAPSVYAPTPAPKPRPPAEKRLKRLSVTDVETLIRDPYALYAKRILGLGVLRAVGSAPGPAERGVAIHAAIEDFERSDPQGRDASLLVALLRRKLHDAGFDRAAVAADSVRLKIAADRFVAWLEGRRSRARTTLMEEIGAITLRGGVQLRGKADRIDLLRDGTGEILDVKSGQPPTDKQVKAGLNPQLPLEAAMLARGAFPSAQAVQASALIYWRFGGRDPGPTVLKLEDGAHAEGEKALAQLEALLAQYSRAEQPFLSKPRAQFINAWADYDLLARRQEWVNAGDEE
ncbi:MAG: PD-(D/E)XK nuclease family protein [Caulobacterales bacterium]|jgi:ATP-dependent helicase/nuclease subunit B